MRVGRATAHRVVAEPFDAEQARKIGLPVDETRRALDRVVELLERCHARHAPSADIALANDHDEVEVRVVDAGGGQDRPRDWCRGAPHFD